MSNRNSCPFLTGDVAVTSTGPSPFLRKSKSARLLLSFALVFGVMLFANATPAFAQFHGVTIQKVCTGPVKVCDTDADCSGAVGECQLNHCDTSGQHTTNCSVRVKNADDFGDTIRILSASDTTTTAGGPVTVNNLPIVAVSGSTTCVVGPFAPCNIGAPGASVTFRDAGYNPTSADPSPLADTASVTISDLCDAPGTQGCNSSPQPVNFGAATNTVSGCSVVNKADSTTCTDTSLGDCKAAGCESGVCVQTHTNVADSTVCTSTSDIAGDCGTPGCEAGNCVATHIPVTDSTPCSVNVTGTPNECKTPGCESGICVAAHINKADSTTCTDTNPTCGFIAGCEGGTCVQNHTPQNCEGCPDANPRLGGGAPSDCTILQTHAFKVDITGPAGQIQGDICIAPSGILTMSGANFTTEDVRLDTDATCSGCTSSRVLGHVFTNPPDPEADLTDEIAACDLAARLNTPIGSNPDSTLTCGPLSPASGKLQGTQTITGNGGVNVICVTDVNVGNGQVITLNGTASDEFIFVVTGNFKVQGKIKVGGAVQIKNVLYNVIGVGADVSFTGGGGGANCCKAEIDGSLIAISRKIALSPGRINGQVCGNKDQSYVSGSSVRCPTQ